MLENKVEEMTNLVETLFKKLNISREEAKIQKLDSTNLSIDFSPEKMTVYKFKPQRLWTE